jgi:hypothetical protein
MGAAVPLKRLGGGTEGVQPASILWAVAGGCSSDGRAPDLQSGGRRFDSDQLHQALVARLAEPGL